MAKVHTVVSGDTLVKISNKYFGTHEKWREIKNANPQLTNRKKASDGSPVLYVGDVLVIPEDVEIPVAVVNKTPVVLNEGKFQDITILIDGEFFTGFTGYRLSFPVDSMDLFSFSAVWDDNKDLRRVFLPFSFKQCTVYYDKKILFTGRLLTSAPEVNPDSKTITIQGYPLCGVLNDCCLPETKYPPCYSNMTLEQIASDVCEPFGIRCEFSEFSGEVFEQVEYEPGQKLLEFLMKLGKQRGFIFTNSVYGMLKFWKLKEENVSASFAEGSLPYFSCKPNFDAQGMFSHITGFTKTEDEADAGSYTYENSFLIRAGVFSPLSVVLDDVDAAGVEDAVKAEAGRMFANCISYQLTVVGHRDAQGALYRKGMCVSVFSPGAMIYRDTKFQVYKCELIRSDTEGLQTVMQLILPGSLDGKLPEVLPWVE